MGGKRARFLRRDDEAGPGLMVWSTSELPSCCCSQEDSSESSRLNCPAIGEEQSLCGSRG